MDERERKKQIIIIQTMISLKENEKKKIGLWYNQWYDSTLTSNMGSSEMFKR